MVLENYHEQGKQTSDTWSHLEPLLNMGLVRD
jgi:hypothetical protein